MEAARMKCPPKVEQGIQPASRDRLVVAYVEDGF